MAGLSPHGAQLYTIISKSILLLLALIHDLQNEILLDVSERERVARTSFVIKSPYVRDLIRDFIPKYLPCGSPKQNAVSVMLYMVYKP